jgi:hypothetical protein
MSRGQLGAALVVLIVVVVVAALLYEFTSIRSPGILRDVPPSLSPYP